MIAAMPPTTAYTAHTKATRSAKEPNTSTATPPLPRTSRVSYILLLWVELAAAPFLSPPGAASYLEAHFACTCSATNRPSGPGRPSTRRSEEHTSELQSLTNLVCRLLLEKKN